MVRSRTSPLDRVLAVALAVIMLIAMIPMSTLTAFALSYEAGGDCQEACGGKLQWVVNPEVEGQHHLVCDNEECARNALIEAYVIHNEGEGGDDCLLCNPPHVHGEFVYSLENDNKTLVATCGSSGTCDLDGKKVSITIAAPTELKYDGNVKAATISGANEWKTATGNDAPEITYNAEPKNVGTYTASITVDEATASVTFNIEKGEPNVEEPQGLTATYNQTLTDVTLPDGFKWDDETLKVGDVGTHKFAATYTPLDTDNYEIVSMDISVEVKPAESVISAPTMKDHEITSITLNDVTTESGGKIEYGYAKENNAENVTNWQTSTLFEGLEGSTNYYFFARVEATENYDAAVSAGRSISTKDKKNGEVTISISGWTYGDEDPEGPAYEIKVGTYTDIVVEWSVKGKDEWKLWKDEVPTKAGQYTVRVVCGATSEWDIATDEKDFKIEQKEVTVKWDNTTFVYNSDLQAPDVTIVSGVLESDLTNVDVAVKDGDAKEKVGTEYQANAVLTGDASSNYVIKSNASTRFSITTKEVIVTWSNTSLIHKGIKQNPTVVINEYEIFDGDNVGINITSPMQQDPGTYTATAALTGADADNYHIQASLVTCGFGISNHEIPVAPYTIVKADAEGKPTSEIANANENHWYNYDVCIVPKDKYEIASQDNEDGDFGSYLFVDSSKENFTFYLRCNDRDCEEYGGYTGAIVVGDPDLGETFNVEKGKINIDKDMPNVSVKLGESTPWEIFLETITFGIYHKEAVTVTISGSDENSGVTDQIFFYKLEKTRLTNEDLFDKNEIQNPSINWEKGTSLTVNVDSDYVIYAKVVDEAGNVSYGSSKDFVYDSTKPVIDVSFDKNNALNGWYFKEDRTIEIKVTDHNFNEGGVKLSVKENGVETGANYSLNWVQSQTNADEYTASVTFTNEADYKIEISCTDLAGNETKDAEYAQGSVATKEFTIDKSRPNASLVIEGLVKDAEKSWKETWTTADGDEVIAKVLDSINYDGRWTNSNAKVSATSTDNLSGVDYIEYFVSEEIITEINKMNDIDWVSTKDLTEGRDAFQFEVEPNEKFIVYVHIVDKAGNDIYLSSNGVIVDDKEPGGDNYSPEIDITLPKANANGIYNEDDTVKVDFKVVEPKYKGADGKGDAGSFSGIQKITYVIKAEDIGQEQTGEFELTDENTEKDTTTGLIGSWTGSITIDKDKFNSNNVVVLITAIDNAGNVHTSTTKAGDIKIDVTDPTIDISYEDVATVDNEKFFKGDRTATIVVTERNFKVEDVKITITNTDGVIPEVKWNATSTGSGDDTKWTATVIYSADGDYTFDIAYTDLADNACAGANYGESIAPTEFTVDKTLPEVSVTYNNNDAKNDKYFAAARTATITVKEHNFDVNRVTFTQTAKLNGTDITLPTASWVNNGDVHTATIVFDKDGDYTFDVTVKDMAGNDSEPANYGNSVAAKDFVVDQTIEKPTIGGVENGKAYKNDVVPTISFADVNYDTYEVKLVRTRLGEKNVDVTDKFIKSVTEQAQGGSGSYDTFEKIVENDGIYTLTVKMIDKAGNEETEEYTFTVNRFGSVYEYGDELVALIKDGGQYVKNVDGDLVITEYNADRLLAGSLKILITRDGETVDVDFTSNPADINAEVGIGESGWYQYVYTIKASNFDKDGVYKISLTSKYAAVDSPENDSTSVPENSIDKQGNAIVDTMNFTVDSVAPEIRNIVNLEENIVNAQTLDVKYTIVDVGGLKSIEVILNGKTIDTITEFGDSAYNYSGQFTINESSDAQTVQIKVTDLAGNVTDTASENFSTNDMYVFNDTVTVSTNFFVRWYANKPLFWGSIGGVVVLAAAVCFIVAAKKKKKESK